jgi:NAD(P)-dependent dehydrogenase (short-subunit alcohol dehydrogenase family)
MTASRTLAGKTCLVTGATNGIGRVAAQALAARGAAVELVARSPERAQRAVAEIRAATGNPRVDWLLADLSDLAQVRRLAGAFRQRHTDLHVLVNNAGGVFARRQETVDGLERTFALNHLSYFLLTCELLALLAASAPARVVNVSSDAHQAGTFRGLDFDDLQGRKRYYSFTAYGRSKLANVLFTYALARRLAGTNVTANALHPGFVRSGFGSGNGRLWDFFYRLSAPFALSPEQGAETIIYLAASPEVEGQTGQYYHRCQAVRSSPASYDVAAQERLWAASRALTGASCE